MIRQIAERFGGQGGRKAVAIVFVALVAFSVVAPFLGGLAVVDSDHSGTAAADVSNSTLDTSLDVSTETANANGITFNADGTKMYVGDAESNNILQYSLSTAYNVSSASHSKTLDISSEGNPSAIRFNADGTKMFVTSHGQNSLFEYELSTAYDVTTATHVNTVGVEFNAGSLEFNDDGTKVFIGDYYQNVTEYDMGTAYDSTTMSEVQKHDFSNTLSGTIKGLKFNGNGSKLLAINNSGQTVEEWDLSTAYDPSTRTHADSLDVSSEDSNPAGLNANDDGTLMYVVGLNTDTLYQYDSEIAWGVQESTSSSSTSSATKQSVGLVEDELEMFPPDDSELVVRKRTQEYVPLWELDPEDPETWYRDSWSTVATKSFNWENKTSVTLEDGEYYEFTVESDHGTWEESGFKYDASSMSDSTIWIRPETGSTDTNDDGTAGGDESTGTNGPGDGSTSDGSSGDSTTSTDEQGFGPTALGKCTTYDGQDGVEVEYWDPDYQTHELNATLSVDGERKYFIHKEFADARGYFRGCIADSVTDNASSDSDLDLSHNATNATGALVSSGGTSYNPPVFAPTGNAPASTGERLGLLAGVIGALGLLWFGGQRYLPGSSVEAWPVDSVSPAFGVGAPLVAALGLDLAGGGVISAAVATGLAQIAPFAGIVGVSLIGYYGLRWIRAPPS